MDALLLCGGFATRLEPITLFVPKPLLPVGGKPILEYIVDDLDKQGIGRFIISTNRKFADQFRYWTLNKRARGFKKQIEIIVEPALHHGEKFGAIKGIHNAIEKLKLNDDLVIVAGDNLYDFSLGRLLEHFKSDRKPTVAVYDVKSLEDAKRFGIVETKNNIIVKFEEKPDNPKTTLASIGMYVFPKNELKLFDTYLNEKNNPDAPGYFVQWLIKKTEVHAVVYAGNWFDIGTIPTYEKVFKGFLFKKKPV